MARRPSTSIVLTEKTKEELRFLAEHYGQIPATAVMQMAVAELARRVRAELAASLPIQDPAPVKRTPNLNPKHTPPAKPRAR